MIRHAVLMRLAEGTPASAVEAMAEALRALPAQIPSIKAYSVGVDLGLAADNWDFMVVADFDDAQSFQAYIDHPAHRAVVRDLIDPVRVESARVQMEL